MAQVLKDELRIKILVSAKDEFLKNGIAGSSMREIAKKAETPVGNIYKYFKNKQDLVTTVLSPLLTNLDNYSFRLLSDKVLLNREAISEFLVGWVDNLVELQNDYPIEMNIIVNDKQINHDYQDGLISLVTSIVSQTKQDMGCETEKVRIVSRVIAKSIFAGVREAVTLKCNSNIDKEEFRKIIYTYMRNTFYMLENID